MGVKNGALASRDQTNARPPLQSIISIRAQLSQSIMFFKF